MSYIHYVDAHIIKRIEDSTVIPMDEGNTDYINYLNWIDEGGVVQEENLYENVDTTAIIEVPSEEVSEETPIEEDSEEE